MRRRNQPKLRASISLGCTDDIRRDSHHSSGLDSFPIWHARVANFGRSLEWAVTIRRGGPRKPRVIETEYAPTVCPLQAHRCRRRRASRRRARALGRWPGTRACARRPQAQSIRPLRRASAGVRADASEDSWRPLERERQRGCTGGESSLSNGGEVRCKLSVHFNL